MCRMLVTCEALYRPWYACWRADLPRVVAAAEGATALDLAEPCGLTTCREEVEVVRLSSVLSAIYSEARKVGPANCHKNHPAPASHDASSSLLIAFTSTVSNTENCG